MLPCSGLVVVLCRKQTWPHQPPRGKLYGGGPGVPGGVGGGVVTSATPTPYFTQTRSLWHSSWVRGMSACGYSVPLRTNCGPEDPGRRSSGVELLIAIGWLTLRPRWWQVKISMLFSSNPGLHNSIHFEHLPVTFSQQQHTPPAAAPQYVVSVNDGQPTFLSSLL